jgi:ParB family chromosome partitioning protein
MAGKRGLGRGFDSLIPTDVLDEAFDPTAAQDEQISDLRLIAPDKIQPNPNQPRKHFDEESLQALANSVKEHGIVQPIVVTPAKDGDYEIVAGERRWRAAKIAGLSKMPAIVRTLSNQHKLELSLIENLQRADLNPLETATAYLKLKTQFNLTYEEMAERVEGRAASTISNVLRLLQLPDFAKKQLAEGQISEGHARQVLSLAPDEEAQKNLVKLIIAEGWSVRTTEQYVIGFKKGEDQTAKKSAGKRAVQTETKMTRSFAKKIGLPVSQKTTAHGGQIIIRFANDDELAKIEQFFKK